MRGLDVGEPGRRQRFLLDQEPPHAEASCAIAEAAAAFVLCRGQFGRQGAKVGLLVALKKMIGREASRDRLAQNRGNCRPNAKALWIVENDIAGCGQRVGWANWGADRN